jgi:hypothetical protein
MRLAVYSDGGSLEKRLSEGEFDKVEETVSRSGFPAETARLFKPWIITMLLAASDCERRRAKAGEVSLDERIAAIARARQIPVHGLETAEGQIVSMAAVGEEEQIDMLKAGLAYAHRTDDLVETTLQFYLSRNMGATWPFQLGLAAKAGYGAGSFTGFKRSMIDERNAKMRDGAIPHLDKGGAFIAVGALHLPGPAGLVALLREAGYSVTAEE